ncbi:Arc family DNA-binding protein [Proteus mirabilis]|uniref:Arc family DNA-binding protein n=1 Tax=Proteus mirabilis TaxID=584 RepID=UPI0010732407|nr:Arc family DNA-binding protein [Proteus mirabilis]EKU7264940.1 Arc family DNA-binding protein [Proteus mirabilis]EKV5076072.1 Arc family DNA-binding protein [Proteus mirabilis]ELA7714611.1 Arc family DNA-binding protein [Proteus mirabilis]ELB1134547.1 Arc family DNA-binding protein [Proteus mirabilis]KAB7723681.1 Arc family DNA-binding protein [Proteus mirabilis]
MSRIAPYPLRMTPEMRERLEKQANENHRSLQQEIIYQLDTMYHIDAVLDSASLKGDSYSRIMTLLKEYKLASQLAGEVERLKHQLSLLSNSVTTPESDKFIEIETQANIIKESVDKILKQIPFRVSGISKKK